MKQGERYVIWRSSKKTWNYSNSFQSLEAIKKSEVYKGEAVRLYMLDEVLFFFVLVATTRVLSGEFLWQKHVFKKILHVT